MSVSQDYSVLPFVLLTLSIVVPIGASAKMNTIGVFVIGDKIPDAAFLHFDPALQFSCVPFPGFTEILREDEEQALARHVTENMRRTIMISPILPILPIL